MLYVAFRNEEFQMTQKGPLPYVVTVFCLFSEFEFQLSHYARFVRLPVCLVSQLQFEVEVEVEVTLKAIVSMKSAIVKSIHDDFFKLLSFFLVFELKFLLKSP